MHFSRNEDKNKLVKKRKGAEGVGFENVVRAVKNGKVLDIIQNPKEGYTDQKIIFIEIDSYVYEVPCIETESGFHLITIYPSRKATKFYNLK